MIKRLLILLTVFSMFLIGIVYAQSTPSLDVTTWKLNTNISISLVDGEGVTDVAVFVASASTANGTTGIIFNISNATHNFWGNNSANFSFSADLILEDANDYVVTFVTTETGGSQTGTSSTGVTVDRTVPSAPTTTQAAGSVLEDAGVISYTVTGTDTTACTIAFLGNGITPRFTGTNTFAMTHSGDTCTYTISNVLSDLTYNVYVQALDGTNTSIASTRLDLQVDVIGSDISGGLDGLSIPIGQSVGGTPSAGTVVIIIILLVGGYYYFYNKNR